MLCRHYQSIQHGSFPVELAGVPLETRKALLGHANGDMTTHYSQAELGELLDAAEKVTNRGVARGLTLAVVKRNLGGVGKLSD